MTDRGVAALRGAVVGDDRHRIGRVAEQIAGHEMQLLLADRLLSPQSAPDGGVDAVGADEHVGLDVVAVAQMDDDAVTGVCEGRHLVAVANRRFRQRIEHPLV